MGNYLQVRSDAEILQSLEGRKSALIVACAGCANNSVAYDKSEPVFKVETGDKGNTVMMPYAIRGEAERIETLLENNRIKSGVELNFCYFTDNKKSSNILESPGWSDLELKDRLAKYESILFLGCAEGVNGWTIRVGDKIKVIPGMRNVGTYECVWSFDEKNRVVRIDKEKSTFIKASS
jgi:ribosomal protein S27E